MQKISEKFIFIKGYGLCYLLMCLFFSLPVQAAISTIGAEQNGITSSGTISYVGAGTSANANGCGNITPSIPAGSNGDLLLAVVNAREEAASATVSITSETWNTYYSATRNNMQVFVFWRIADGTEGATATINQSGTCNSILGQISRFSGVDNNNPFETDPIQAGNSVQQNSGNLDTGTETTTSPNAMSIVTGYIADNRTISNADATADGYTQSFDTTQTAGRDSSISLHYMLETTAGNKSIANWDFSGGGNDRNYGVIFALKPSGLTINVPPGTGANDFMVAAIAVRPSSSTIAAPNGWTFLRRTDQGAGNSNSQAIYYRVATAAEPTSYTWTFSGTAITGAAGGIISYSGVDTSSPIDVDGGNTTPSSTSHTANSVTTTVDDAMLISMHSYSSAQNWTPPGGMTEQVDVFSTAAPSGAGIALEMNDELLGAAGATGSRTAVADASADTGVGQMVALTPLITSAGITVTMSGFVKVITAGAVSFTGAEIGSPEANATNSNAGSNTITTNISTLTDNAFLMDVVGADRTGSFTPGASQTERWDLSPFGFDSTGAGSTKQVATAGADSMSQTFSIVPNKIAHAVAAFAPASGATISFDNSTNNTALFTNTSNWTHTFLTVDDNTKLVVGVAIEEGFGGGCVGDEVVSSVTFNGTPMIFINGVTITTGGICERVELWYIDFRNIILSTRANSTLGGQAIDQDEAVEYDAVNDTGTLFFDEATFNANERLNGLHLYSNGNLAISTAGGANIGGNTFANGDIVEVTPSGTAGVYDFVGTLFAESNFTGNETVDAVYVRENGNIILSTTGNATLPACGGGTFNFNDNTLIEWDVTNTCGTSIINFNPLMSACGGNGDEDIDAVHYLGDDENLVLISIINNCTIDGQSFLDGDVILYNRNTSSAALYFDESNFTGGEDIDAITLDRAISTAPVVDHYAISYPLGTPGVTCEAQTVRITAHGDPTDHSILVAPSSSTTITLSTSPATDSWALKTGGGIFTPPNQYTFDGIETFAEFWLTETTATTAPHIDIDVTDGTATDLDGVLEDDNIEFADAVFRFIDGGGTGESIETQIAGKESDINPLGETLQLRSVITNSTTMACEARILNLQTIEMAYKCNNPTTCESTPTATRVQIENAAASTFDITPGNDNATTVDATNGSYSNVDLDFGVTGAATFSFDFNDVGQITLYAREVLAASPPDPAITVFGASNSFIVRPFGFDIDSGGQRAADWLDNNALDDSTGTNLSYAANSDGSDFASAGHSTNTFSLTLRSVVWEAADDADNDGVSDSGANLTDNALTPNFGEETANSELVDVTSGNVRPTNVGTLFFGDDLDFSVGTITTNLAFDEVGIVDLTAALDTGNYLSGGVDVTSTHQDFGRFIPDRFTLADNSPTLENSCVAGGFTYMEESFYYGSGNEPAITITAVNENGDTTVNYGDGGTPGVDDYWKLPTALDRTYDDNGTNNGTTFNDLAVASVIATGDDDFDGIGVFTLSNTSSDRDSFMFDRASVDLNAAEGSPFTASIDLLIQVTASSLTDTDGVCFDGDGDGTCEIDGSDDYTALTDTGGTALSLNQLRFGRFTVGTAVGSELLTLSPPLRAEYFDGTGFVLNTDDSCTFSGTLELRDHLRLGNSATGGGALQLGDATMNIGSGTSAITTFNSPLTGGDTGTVFSAPGTGNTGFVNIFGNLGCNIILPSACVGTETYDHLRFDWDDLDGNDDGPYDGEPTGRIDFGLFEGPRNYIYIREPW